MRMREIKFRAWSPKYAHLGMLKVDDLGWDENDKMSGNLLRLDGSYPGIGRIYFWEKNNGYSLSTQDNDIFYLMQYTGIKDKSGNEVYEGDIVFLLKVDGRKGDIATFEFNAPNYYLRGKKGDYELGENLSDPSCYAVIGNIYENPELVKEDEQE